MTFEISLAGLATIGGNEDRALANINVNYNGTLYDWQIFVPTTSIDLNAFLVESAPIIQSQIDKKELEWANLNPKTKTITDPFTDEEIVVDIEKHEIVRPDIPDYYALRRNEYPSLAEQLGAVWKGMDSQEYMDMQQRILNVKNKYPKD